MSLYLIPNDIVATRRKGNELNVAIVIGNKTNEIPHITKLPTNLSLLLLLRIITHIKQFFV